jgi:hypothetical protein
LLCCLHLCDNLSSLSFFLSLSFFANNAVGGMGIGYSSQLPNSKQVDERSDPFSFFLSFFLFLHRFSFLFLLLSPPSTSQFSTVGCELIRGCHASS